MDRIILNDGVEIPQIGFGTFMIPADGTTYTSVREALDAGYRHIDTAAVYFNEEEVGKAIRDSGIDREKIFLTSKLWITDFGYERAKKGLERSLKKLGTYMDLCLIHHPYGDVAGAWKAMVEYREAGRIRSIGVSNFSPAIWKALLPQVETVPSVNQIECKPFAQQKAVRELMAADDVKTECWFPLGHGDPELLENPVILELAEKYGKDAGQIIIRFEIQDGMIALPKSTKAERIRSNLEVFDFSLTEEEMNGMYALDTGTSKHDPDAPGVEDYLKSAFVIED